MLGVSGFMGENSGDGDTSGNHEAKEGFVGLITGGFEEDGRGRGEEGDRNSAGNRWPRQETMDLLQIRSDMDVAFRDSGFKGPLWEEVSRKLAELGYHRSSKKCKEKFENVYKYYKRTKEGRATRPDGKTYRFFDQLEALDSHLLLPSPSQEKHQIPMAATPTPTPTPKPKPKPKPNPSNVSHNTTVPSSFQNPTTDFLSPSTSSSPSSEDTRKKKKKMAGFFDRLMKEVAEKQEALQKKFLEALEKRENDRMVREEAWKMQELARMNRQHEILVQERSIAAAKDAAVIAFLQKISEQSNPVQLQENPSQSEKIIDIPRLDNGENFIQRSSSRWPKSEVQALINLRTCLDLQYQETGPKGPLWEEISSAMKKHGYNRSAKRCKEKWENINKYFKKVKESSKKRPEDSKTCPYYDQLDALYKEKTKKIMGNSLNPGFDLKPEDHLVQQIMNQPEQQQPLSEAVMEDLESENMDQNQDDEDRDDEDEDEGSGYEIVTNNPSSVAIVE